MINTYGPSDVIDDEIESARMFVACESCGESDEAMNMVYRFGSWTCLGCELDDRREWTEVRRWQ